MLVIIKIEVAAERCSESKNALLGNDCHLLKVKRRDSIIATSINDRAHTVFMKTNITFEREDAKKHVQS